MRKLSHPVSIITTNQTSSNQFHGTTISSLTSISIDPIPLISFSLRLPSTLFSILSTHQHHSFNVHLLNSSDQSVQLSKIYSNPRSSLMNEVKGIEDQELLHQFENDQIGFGKLVCKIWKTIELVEELELNQPNQIKSILILAKVIKVIEFVNHDRILKPLLYHNRTYTTLKD
ncbi:flavin reductase like domain-containing protein [Melampsora americana]|nr:flavin reductase like domain-containing protein [Melampsora americana]